MKVSKKSVVTFLLVFACCLAMQNIAKASIFNFSKNSKKTKKEAVSAINANVKRVIGCPFSRWENAQIFKNTKTLIFNHEVSVQNRKKGIPDLKAYVQKGDVPTACYGNTHIRDKEGNFVRNIRRGDVFTVEQCDEIFRNHFTYIDKELYKSMTDSNGDNYYNMMHYTEVSVLHDIFYHNGVRGSKRVVQAMINFVHYRTTFGLKRLEAAIDTKLKKSTVRFNFQPRRENYKEIIRYIYSEKFYKTVSEVSKTCKPTVIHH